MAWALLVFSVGSLIAAGLALRWWLRLAKLDYRELEKALTGYESFHLPPQQRMAIADSIRPKLAILVVFVVLAACVLSWKALEAFLA